MNTINKHELIELSAAHASPSVSIYLPTVRAGRETGQNIIRFKNLVASVEGQLQTDVYRKLDGSAAVLHDLKRLLEDSLFWHHQADGLALFAQPGRLVYFRLPVRFRELAVVTRRFHLKPLMPLLYSSGIFFILALSGGWVQVFQGTRERVHEIEFEDLPQPPGKHIEEEVQKAEVGSHTRTPSHHGRRDAGFYGPGQTEASARRRFGPYLKRLARAVDKRLEPHDAPLVVAGPEHFIPIYRDFNTYPHLMEQFVTGHPAGLAEQELHRRSWEIVRPHFEHKVEAAIGRYQELRGRNNSLATDDLETAIIGAYNSRVETLFVPVGVQLWGAYDRDHNRPVLHEQHHPDDQDLFDFAAIRTLLNGGMVYAVDPDAIPGGGHVAAILRF